MSPPSINSCRGYLMAEAAAAPSPEEKQAPAITISRETGTDAGEIGRLTAEYLESRQRSRRRWFVFDKELVEEVLKDHELPLALARFMPESVTSDLRDAVEEMLGVHPSSWTLREHTVETMLKLATRGRAILIGRGSNVATAALPHVLHVRLVAPLNQRVDQIAKRLQLTPREAGIFIRTTDRARARFVSRHFQTRIDDPLKYHLTINTGMLKPAQAARLIADAARRLKA